MTSLETKCAHYSILAGHRSKVAKTFAFPVRKYRLKDVARNTDPHWQSHTSIKFETRVFELTEPLIVKFEQNQDRMWEASAAKLGIIAFGETPIAAFRYLQEEFAVIWDGLAFESDEWLTEDARQLKAVLRKMVKLL